MVSYPSCVYIHQHLFYASKAMNKEIVKGISYNNAVKYFGFDVQWLAAFALDSCSGLSGDSGRILRNRVQQFYYGSQLRTGTYLRGQQAGTAVSDDRAAYDRTSRKTGGSGTADSCSLRDRKTVYHGFLKFWSFCVLGNTLALQFIWRQCNYPIY